LKVVCEIERNYAVQMVGHENEAIQRHAPPQYAVRTP
jgi:hypothetical protein